MSRPLPGQLELFADPADAPAPPPARAETGAFVPTVFDPARCQWPPSHGRDKAESLECQMPSCVVDLYPRLAAALAPLIKTPARYARPLTALYRSEDTSDDAVRADVAAAVAELGLRLPPGALAGRGAVVVPGAVVCEALGGGAGAGPAAPP